MAYDFYIFDDYNVSAPLSGTSYNDYINSRLGDDEVTGGSGGNDLIIAGPDYAVAGYSDNDTVYGDTFKNGSTHDEIWGGYGNDILYGDSFEGLGGGNDVVSGGYGNDLLIGGGGNDILDGGYDNDTIKGDAGDDSLYGGTGYDIAIYEEQSTISYAAFDSTGFLKITGSEGTDSLIGIERVNFGTSRSYNVYAGDGNNNSLTADSNVSSFMWGGNGDDILKGANGSDTLTGSYGNDTLIGGTGYDAATYFGHYTAYNAAFTSDGTLRVTGSEGTDLLRGIERIYFETGGFYNVRVGDGNNNNLTADPNVWSFVWGGGGNDTVTGSNGNDTLAGGSGSDTLIGGTGNDILIGGAGQDTLTAGLGADKFRFEFQTERIDVIRDFNWNEGDKIEIVKSSFGATSLGQFSYNNTTGALFFDASSSDNVGPLQVATVANKPTGFSVQLDVVLV